MIAGRAWLAPALFIFPSITTFAGVALAATIPGGLRLSSSIWLASLVAGAAPLVASLALMFCAPRYDRVLLAAAGMLTGVGTTSLCLLAGTSSADPGFYQSIASRHGLFVGAGFVALVGGAAASGSVDRLARYPVSFLILALALTTLTVAVGEEVNGARLWLRLGPVRFQPSEVARLLLAGFVAIYLYDRRHLISSSWRVRSFDLPPAPYLMPLAGAILGAAGVLVLQNDLGMAALVVLGALASLFGIQQSKTGVFSAFVILASAMVASYAAVDRVRERVAGWLEPWSEPAGRGFQFVQADYAFAAGQIAGHARPLAATVPEVQTDFILVAIGTQFGWLAAVAVLALVATIVSRCVLVALRSAHGLRAMLALSLAALLGLQTLLIAGGALRVLPLTGLTFPLVSYGGTSMVVTLFAIGVICGFDADPRHQLGQVQT